MSETAWFRHDSNAKDDTKIVQLIEQLGLEGYGIYWVLIETLREQKDFAYPIKLVPSLARKYVTSSEKILTVIRGYKLFQEYETEDGDYFFSVSLNNRMGRYQEIIEKRRIAGQKGGKMKGIGKQLPSKPEANAKQTESNCQANRLDKNRIDMNRIDISNDMEFNFDRLKNSQFIFSIHSFLTNLKLTIDPDELNELLDAYIIAMKADNDIYRNENDYRAHFRNWVKIQVEKKKPVNAYSGLNERKPLFDDLS